MGKKSKGTKKSSSGVKDIVELLEYNDIINVGDGYIVMSPREPAKQLAVRPSNALDIIPTGELGSASPSPWTSWIRQEYNVDLMGVKGLQTYDMMRRNDGTVRGTLRLVKTPVLSARWFMHPYSTSSKDQEVADFVWKCFTEYMSTSWTQILIESLLMLDFGYYMFEKVWTNRVINGKMRTVFQKLAPRHPMDVAYWELDSHGGPKNVLMYPADMYAFDLIPIPIEKLLVFSFDKEASDIEGISVLRSAYKHWYYKEQLYKIDAIQKERHSIGVPIITLPMGYSEPDKKMADQLGRNLRTNERSHVILPPGWTLEYADMRTSLPDPLTSIAHHDHLIEKNILAPFLDKGGNSDDQTIFMMATRFIADTVVDVFNTHAIPQLVDMNYTYLDGYPKLRARRIGEQEDWRTMSFAIRNMVGAGVIVPDDKLEEYVRHEFDLPQADPATARDLPTPQGPPGSSGPAAAGPSGKAGGPDQAGLPRQSTSLPKSSASAGSDRSGGK